MRKVVFLGNCQAERYRETYAQSIAPVLGDKTGFIASYEPPGDAARSLMAEADVVVAQLFDSEPEAGLHNLETGGQILRFPTIYGMFIWPYGGDAHPANRKSDFPPQGPFPADMGDRWLNRKMRGGALDDAAIEAIADDYLALDVAKSAYAERLCEIMMNAQRQRDETCGFQCADLIELHLHDAPVFDTPSTFFLPLYRHVTGEIFDRLGASREVLADALDEMTRSPFAPVQRPVHPSVARFFDLRYIGGDQRYTFHTGERLTLREFVIRYLRYA